MLRMIRYKVFLLFSFGAFTLPLVSFAHTKWFARGDLSLYAPPEENVLLYALVWGAIAFAIVAAGVIIEKMLPRMSEQKRRKLELAKPKAASIFSILAGAFLLIASYSGFIFSPNLYDVGPLHSILLWVQAIIGAGLLIGFGVRAFSLLLIALWAFLLSYVGVLEIFENIGVLGAAIFLLIYGRSHFRIIKTNFLFRIGESFSRYENYTFPILRVFFGANLFLLGFSEKLLHPEYGLAFLAEYQWNFMHNLGIEWFSNYLFVFSAGAVESLFGLIFILGVVTRLNAFVVGIFFTIPLFLLGPTELIGHLPHFVITALLLIFGSGDRFKLVHSRE